MKQILSSRSFLFEKEEYTDDPNSTQGHRVRSVSARVRVVASDRPQLVPDWVADTDLFNAAIEDGTIMEFVMRKQPQLASVNNESKAPAQQQAAEFAKFADDNSGQQSGNNEGQKDGLIKTNDTKGWGK